MNTITITFTSAESVKVRKDKICQELNALLPIEIIEATLNTPGRKDFDYQWDIGLFIHQGTNNDDELLSANRLIITYETIQVQRCNKCGCWQNQACMHDKLGPCWWVKDDLCSHCQLEKAGKITDVVRPWKKTEVLHG